MQERITKSMVRYSELLSSGDYDTASLLLQQMSSASRKIAVETFGTPEKRRTKQDIFSVKERRVEKTTSDVSSPRASVKYFIQKNDEFSKLDKKQKEWFGAVKGVGFKNMKSALDYIDKFFSEK